MKIVSQRNYQSLLKTLNIFFSDISSTYSNNNFESKNTILMKNFSNCHSGSTLNCRFPLPIYNMEDVGRLNRDPGGGL